MVRQGKFGRFSLVLMVTRDCTLRCSYCYNGPAAPVFITPDMGRKAIARALHSLDDGGTLELGIFGGEPLLQAGLILELLDTAREGCASHGMELRAGLTTNGTVSNGMAWRVMTQPDIDVAVSHDGLPEIHDRHRLCASGAGSWRRVTENLLRLLSVRPDTRVVTVVRPDTVGELRASLEYLHSLGVRVFDPSLDLWARWTASDLDVLDSAIADTTAFWRQELPDISISWLDEKVARLAGLPCGNTARCGFGCGEVAVAPSGRLYPCERLIGQDLPDSPLPLPGDVWQGDDFTGFAPVPVRNAAACAECEIASVCNTHCRCSNYVRTGDVARPDGLLCRLNRACVREVQKVFEGGPRTPSSVSA